MRNTFRRNNSHNFPIIITTLVWLFGEPLQGKPSGNNKHILFLSFSLSVCGKKREIVQTQLSGWYFFFFLQVKEQKFPNDLIFQDPPAQYIIFASISTRNTVEESVLFIFNFFLLSSLERLYFIISETAE